MCMITPLWSKLNMDLILGGSRCTISAMTSSIIWAFTHNNINMSQIRGSWVACLFFPVLLETEELLLYLEKVKYILAESTERSLNWALEAVFIIVELRSARQKQWGLWLGSTEHALVSTGCLSGGVGLERSSYSTKHGWRIELLFWNWDEPEEGGFLNHNGNLFLH